MIKISVPKNVKEIISRLEEHGFEAYAVGGCVRDSILQRVPDDWDITTSANPVEVKALFLHTIDTGIKHGTVTVMLGKEGFEVTTFRIDGTYSDGRHPDEIAFTSSLIEDLKRRDFTINAMAYSESKGLIDAFSGVEDLKKGVIRSVGIPEERFGEDALRMLRAIRFAGQLEFEIEEATYHAIESLVQTIEKVSVERIAKELEKLILSTGVEKLVLVYKCGMMKYILPSLHFYIREKEERIKNLLALMKETEFPDKKGLHIIRWSLLLEELGKDRARLILKTLKLDNETIDKVGNLVEIMKRPPENNKKEMRWTVHEGKYTLMPLLFEIRRAKGLATGEELYREILEKNEATEISALAVGGNDLMQIGIPKGKEVGVLLKKLLTFVLDNPEMNTREKLLEEAKKHET